MLRGRLSDFKQSFYQAILACFRGRMIIECLRLIIFIKLDQSIFNRNGRELLMLMVINMGNSINVMN